MKVTEKFLYSVADDYGTDALLAFVEALEATYKETYIFNGGNEHVHTNLPVYTFISDVKKIAQVFIDEG